MRRCLGEALHLICFHLRELPSSALTGRCQREGRKRLDMCRCLPAGIDAALSSRGRDREISFLPTMTSPAADQLWLSDFSPTSGIPATQDLVKASITLPQLQQLGCWHQFYSTFIARACPTSSGWCAGHAGLPCPQQKQRPLPGPSHLGVGLEHLTRLL